VSVAVVPTDVTVGVAPELTDVAAAEPLLPEVELVTQNAQAAPLARPNTRGTVARAMSGVHGVVLPSRLRLLFAEVT
jgi:hypothetical protein